MPARTDQREPAAQRGCENCQDVATHRGTDEDGSTLYFCRTCLIALCADFGHELDEDELRRCEIL